MIYFSWSLVTVLFLPISIDGQNGAVEICAVLREVQAEFGFRTTDPIRLNESCYKENNFVENASIIADITHKEQNDR